ncbi:hypothetical protein NMG60_11000676 [Bertholletia excelsa]
MPLTPQVPLDLSLKDLISFIKSWRTCTFGQISTSFGLSLSSKCLTGIVSSLEISFLFPLSTALSGLFLLNEKHQRRGANTSL